MSNVTVHVYQKSWKNGNIYAVIRHSLYLASCINTWNKISALHMIRQMERQVTKSCWPRIYRGYQCGSENRQAWVDFEAQWRLYQVMIDDLVTKDDSRLWPVVRIYRHPPSWQCRYAFDRDRARIGLVDDERWARFEIKSFDNEMRRLDSIKLQAGQRNQYKVGDGLSVVRCGWEFLRQGFSYQDVVAFIGPAAKGRMTRLSNWLKQRSSTRLYFPSHGSGAGMKRMEKCIPANIDWDDIDSITTEARSSSNLSIETIGQASRISKWSADISILVVLSWR